MSNYAKGARLERRLKKQLEGQGYTVTRSAGSKGQIDLIAWNRRELLLIQVKSPKNSGTPAALKRLADLTCPPQTAIFLYEVGESNLIWTVQDRRKNDQPRPSMRPAQRGKKKEV